MCIYNRDKSCRLDKRKSSFLMWTYPFCFKLNLGKDESQVFPVLFYEAGGCAVKGNSISAFSSEQQELHLIVREEPVLERAGIEICTVALGLEKPRETMNLEV